MNSFVQLKQSDRNENDLFVIGNNNSGNTGLKKNSHFQL